MFDRVQIENFRGFESLELRELARCNLIVGANDSGKTALLEALQLLCWPTRFETPSAEQRELADCFPLLRGVEQHVASNDRTVGWLFHKGDLTKAIVVRGVVEKGDQAGKKREVRYELQDAPQGIRQGVEAQRRQAEWFIDNVSADQRITAGSKTRLQFTNGRLSSSNGTRIPDLPLSVITTSQPPRQLAHFARWFTKLEADGELDGVIALLRGVEPRLRALSVAASEQGPYLHADLGLGRRMPISFLGDGFMRFLLLAMRLFEARGGLLLIDEIESSFHRSVLDQVFAFLRDATRKFDVQLFATTHSWETLEAAHAAFSASAPYDLAVQRLARDGERAVAHHLGQEAIEAALATGLDIR